MSGPSVSGLPAKKEAKTVGRREFLGGLLAIGGGAALGGCAGSHTTSRGTHPATTRPPTSTPPPRSVVLPVGTRPNPRVAAGTDLIPEFDHLVVCMMENHSFDNMLGVLGRGDGLTLGSNGLPTNSNPYGTGRRLRSFHLESECQLVGRPTQTWNASHAQFDHGTCEGFAESASGPVAMGYYRPSDMPFTSSLARAFPISDRWFCSVLAQTYPNRRYLLAGTSLGLVDDSLVATLPPSGTILDHFNRYGVSWRNYYSDVPSIYCWYGLLSDSGISEHVVPVADFFTDCARGSLPAFSLVDPNFETSSEENPQDVQVGDAFLARVVRAVTTSPSWGRILFLWTYDEHGGYYDHVPPPSAPEPDGIAPVLRSGDVPGAFDRFGFRVPMGLVSPYARTGYVSHTICDHTSVLKLCERKWNLPALTRRDGAANDFLDMVDFTRPPSFRIPPTLAPPPEVDRRACSPGDAGAVPPASAVYST